MNDFFSFLFALLTFDWLRNRTDVEASAAAHRMLLFPTEPCHYCDDELWYDITPPPTWRHLSTGKVNGTKPKHPPISVGGMRRRNAEAIAEIRADDPRVVTADGGWKMKS